MDDEKPPASPVGADMSAQKPVQPSGKTSDGEPAFTNEDLAKAEAQLVERAKAPPIERKRPEIYETLKPHLEEANGPATEGSHPRVHEHAALRDLKDVREFDANTGQFVMRPHWKVRVLLAWWKKHGLEHHSRISPQHFEAALHEALHGRV